MEEARKYRKNKMNKIFSDIGECPIQLDDVYIVVSNLQ